MHYYKLQYMRTIVAITNAEIWERAQQTGSYTQSTLDKSMEAVGFLHCTNPDQTIATANRHFTDREHVILLLINLEKVASEVRFEAAKSGRPGLFPHIYGPLNIDAVYATLQLEKNESGQFIEPERLTALYS